MEEHFVPVEGRTVVYHLREGQWRPAQIVRANGSTSANLLVFLDGTNDTRLEGEWNSAPYEGMPFFWATSRLQGHAVGQWLPRKPGA